ncbi:hypothetical protein ABZ757_10590, partial [Streptomyces albidoflavus]
MRRGRVPGEEDPAPAHPVGDLHAGRPGVGGDHPRLHRTARHLLDQPRPRQLADGLAQQLLQDVLGCLLAGLGEPAGVRGQAQDAGEAGDLPAAQRGAEDHAWDHATGSGRAGYEPRPSQPGRRLRPSVTGTVDGGAGERR